MQERIADALLLRVNNKQSAAIPLGSCSSFSVGIQRYFYAENFTMLHDGKGRLFRMKKERFSRLEVLAPAGSMDALVAAVRCGADAVYLGQKNFSARKNSQNFDEETLTEAVRYAHRCGAKIHQALNIIVFEQEFAALKECIHAAVRAGVDAMIVQDWGVAALVREYAPDMPLHASTQMAVHSPAGAKLAQELGFSRIVLARELSRKEIERIVRSTPLETEIFVHGAHCMSISGQCYLSAAIGGKSGNRGQCAQPCRLPFQAGSSVCRPAGENVLSLKDMDLTERLREIEQMGVTSVKIEGRMKRPEYVAASVTACRQALRGEKPDLDTLQAVFSRSGFTDGYYAGRRDKTMFGFRTKEDVTAAGDVFGNIRNLYHKQTPLVPVQIGFSMRAGAPVSLALSDGEREVTVNGAPPETAAEGSRPADAEYVRRSLEKLGGTPYYVDSSALDIRVEENLMIRASALNAMRREAVEKLDKMRENAPERHFVDLPLPLFPARETGGKLFLWGRFADISQLSEGAAQFFDHIILPAAEVKKLLEEKGFGYPGKLLPVLPRFTFSEEACRELLEQLCNLGCTALYCESGAHMMLGKEKGLVLYGGPYLNLSNPAALDQAEKLGLSAAVLSPEGKRTQLSALSRKSGIQAGIYAYGRMALMAVRNCPVRAQIGCKACGRSGYLVDRMNVKFPVRCDTIEQSLSLDNAVSYILNSLPLSMTDKQDALRDFDFALLDFTIESAVEVKEILTHWRQGTPLPEYTRGLYTRGVLS